MARKKTNASVAKPKAATKLTELDAFLAGKRHPLENDIQTVRKLILDGDASLRAEIKWNSISFRNDHDFFATVNLRSTSSVQLVFYTGVKKKATAETGVQVDDPCGLIEKWLAKDRCLVTLGKGAALGANKAPFAALVKGWLAFVR